MKGILLCLTLMTGIGISQLPPSPVSIKIAEKPKTQVQSDTKQLLVIQGQKQVFDVVFKYPANVNVNVYRDTLLYASMDRTNWVLLGKNVIQLGVNKNGPKLFFKQKML